VTEPDGIDEARRALGRQLAAVRKAIGYSQTELAARVGYSRSTIANLETGRQDAAAEFWRDCDTVLGTAGDLSAAHEEIAAIRRRHRQQVAAQARAARQTKVRELQAAGMGAAEAASMLLEADREDAPPPSRPGAGRGHRLGDRSLFSPAEEDDMRRRTLLSLMTAGLATTAFGPEPARRLLDLALTSEPRSIDDWQLACGDHLYAIRTRAPHLIHDDILLDLLTIQRQMDQSGAGEVTELHRVMAGLSTLHANVLTRLGEHGSALRWWRTAKHAADSSGDLDLRLLVRGSEAGFGLYGQRDPETILQLTRKAQHLAGKRPSLGLTYIIGTQAKALSLLGRHEEANHAMTMFVHSAPEDLPSGPIPAFWTSDQVDFTQSWVHAAAGDEARADAARDRVLAHAFLDYQYRANVRLHEALCTVANGGVDQGVRQAATVLDALPPNHHSQMITETARIVLCAVPAEQRQRPAVGELRETIATAGTWAPQATASP
jgi:transcriptional regulator with XRE-family HTH domain